MGPLLGRAFSTQEPLLNGGGARCVVARRAGKPSLSSCAALVMESGSTTTTCGQLLAAPSRKASTALTSMSLDLTVRLSQSISGQCHVSPGIPKGEVEEVDRQELVTALEAVELERLRSVRGLSSAYLTTISQDARVCAPRMK